MSHDEKTSKGTIHGPFHSGDMDKWNNEGVFTMESQLAWNQKNEFLTMEEFVKNPSFIINLAGKYMNIERYFVNWMKFESFPGEKEQLEESIVISTESLKGMLGLMGDQAEISIKL